jgi:glutamyl-tRNA reductase
MNLNLSLAGVDHHTPIDIREKAVFTVSEVIEAINRFKREGISAVILSTCNRTEVYCEAGCADEAGKLLMSEKDISKSLIYQKAGKDVTEHLFKVTAGFESLLVGEDQILGQVKDAIAISQGEGCSSGLLNQLFRVAVSAAKEIKTKLFIRPLPVSTPMKALEFVRREFGGMPGTRVEPVAFGECVFDGSQQCVQNRLEALVIGNGQIGMQTASLFSDCGISVTMTKRRDISECALPAGLRIIPFCDRYDAVGKVDIIVSATASPHFTLDFDNFNMASRVGTAGDSDPKRIFMLDLAVPRDIDPRIGRLYNVRLYDTDDMVLCPIHKINMEKVEQIWDRYRIRLTDWAAGRQEVYAFAANACH